MSKTKNIITHSRMACFRACPRKHYLRYELGLTAITDDMPRRVGSSFHALLEAADKGEPTTIDLSTLDDPYMVEMTMAMFHGHLQYQGAAEDGISVVASELEFDLPLVNPDTGYPSLHWRFAGKIDRIVQLRDGRIALMEYKTTSRDFSPGAEYWQHLHLDQQLSLYVIAARQLGYNVETILYDVTRRPGMRPYKATPTETRKYKADGTLYANQRAEDETPAEYGQRIRDDIAERPGYYFARIEIARLEDDLRECQGELWQQQTALRDAQRTSRWYRNPSSCYGLFPCEYLPICINKDLAHRTPTGFVRAENVHPELGTTLGAL